MMVLIEEKWLQLRELACAILDDYPNMDAFRDGAQDDAPWMVGNAEESAKQYPYLMVCEGPFNERTRAIAHQMALYYAAANPRAIAKLTQALADSTRRGDSWMNKAAELEDERNRLKKFSDSLIEERDSLQRQLAAGACAGTV